MSKYEFLNELRSYLNEQLPAAEVSQHVDYYRSYIDGEVGRGRSEADVLNELGDPRIVGKSVIDSAKFSGHAGHSQTSYTESYGQTSYGQTQPENHIIFDTSTVWGKIKLAAIIIMIIAVLIVILRFAIGLLSYILPALIVVGIISYFMQKNKK